MSDTIKNVMTVKQTLKCGLHSPEKWQEDYNGYDADDMSNLPNYAPVGVYTVDEYPACPDNWEHGSDIAGSYFASLAEDGALWLDFNGCFDHTHDVAVVLSVQGINPITGQTMVGDNPLRMEQYHKTCPIHGTEFKQDYLCEDCGFKWPGQNYLSTTGTPFGMLWLDGFRTPDGKVRQYIISAEKMRGIAAQVMEKRGEDSEDRVFAIGVAFYISKDKKPDMPKLERKDPQELGFIGNVGIGSTTNPMFFSPMHTPGGWSGGKKKYGSSNSGGFIGFSSVSKSSSNSNSSSTGGGSDAIRASSVSIPDSHDGDAVSHSCDIELTSGSLEIDSFDGGDMMSLDGAMQYAATDITILTGADARAKRPEMYETVTPVTPVKKLEVGAGALVSQRVYDDPKNLKKYWEETPAGMIYINYCDEETLKKILDGGKKATKKDGFLDGVQVG